MSEKSFENGINTPDLSVELAGVELKSPVIPASGTFGFGKEFFDLYDLDILGSIAIKGTTLLPRDGNPSPRIAECPAGMLNSVGLQNPGVDKVISEEIPELAKHFHGPLTANISGFSVEEYGKLAEKMDAVDEVGLIEVNVSCPNVHNGGMAFGQDPSEIAKVTEAVKKNTGKPVFMKLSPNVTDIRVIARACADAGADGLSLINTVLGMRIDISTGKPVLANGAGGYSGPGIFPVAVRMIYEVSREVELPIIGMGGISRAEDVIEVMMAGASAVEIGSANIRDPFACERITEDLPRVMKKLGIGSLKEIIGKAGR